MDTLLVTNEKRLIAVDPGSSKCGIAVVSMDDGNPVSLFILTTSLFLKSIRELEEKYKPQLWLTGDGTCSLEINRTIKELSSVPLTVVDEEGSTLEGRRLWSRTDGAKGLLGCMPFIIQSIFEPESLDDYAAWALALRYLNMAVPMK